MDVTRERAERIVRIGELSFRMLSSTGDDNTTSTPFVLVHGIGVSHRYFSRLHDELAKTADVYSVDLPGFGGLPKPPESLTVVEMARGLGKMLDELGLERVVLIGHSMGAQWVTELAVQRPELATHVVVMGPVTDAEHRSVTAQSMALSIDSLREPPTANFVVFTDYIFRCGPRWYARQVGHMIDYPLEERVRLLQAPLLVMRGGRDPIAGLAWCRRVRDAAPDGSLVIIPGRPHVIQYTAPRAVASALHAFVRTSRRAEEPMR